MQKLFEVLNYISIVIVVICGAFGVVYEYLLWDRSWIPDALYNTVFVLGYISVAYIVVYANREKIFKRRSKKDSE